MTEKRHQLQKPLADFIILFIKQLLDQKEVDNGRKIILNLAKYMTNEQQTEIGQAYITSMARDGRWKEAIGFSLNQNLKYQFKNEPVTITKKTLPGSIKQSKEHLKNSRALVIRELARGGKTLIGVHGKDKDGYMQFLLTVVKSELEDLYPLVSIPEICAASEMVGAQRDILPLYEFLIDSQTISNDEQHYIKERWLKVKTQQIERMEKDPSQEKNIGTRRNELKDKLREWIIKPEEISSLNDTPDPNTELKRTKTLIPTSSLLDINWASPQCLIKHPSSGGFLIIDVNSGNINSWEINISQQVNGDITKIEVPEWDLQGEFTQKSSIRISVGEKEYTYEV
jgi:hypothetical protein